MSDTAQLKAEIEDLIFLEADYCDDWKLEEWMALWADGEVTYEVGPLDTPEAEETTTRDVLYLVSDNRFRLEQRIIRLGKSTAHSESPIRSRLRHLYSNIRQVSRDGDNISFRVNMVVTRTRRDTDGVTILPGYVAFKLVRHDGDLKIREKRVFLDLHKLSNPGTISVLV